MLLAAAGLLLVGGCAKPPPTGKTALHPASYRDLQGYLLSHKPDLAEFRLRGPFEVAIRDDYEVRLPSGEAIQADLYVPAHADKAPLAIILHGYGNSKAAHSYQALHLASWGMSVLAVDLPNTGPWVRNGRTLARLVETINRRPELIEGRIDAGRMVLIGHSFGGVAVAVALAEGAPAAGGILLDPAAIGRDLPGYLRRVKAPVMLLGADEEVSLARNRDFFFRYIPGAMSEVSIRDATHEDAEFSLSTSAAPESVQVTFASALTAAAFSIVATGKFDYAWACFGGGLDNKWFYNARKK